MTDESLTSETTRSVLWMTAQKWVTRVGGLATMIILTRILSPEDFGLVAAVSTLLPLVYVLADVGFSTYIVQADRVRQHTLSTAFWFSLLTGLGLTLLFYLLAYPISLVLNLPAVTSILQVMAISMLLIAVGSVPLALMRRRMQFRSLALAEFVGYITAQAAAVASALAGGGAWALVLQLLVAQVVSTVWVWIAARWRPSWEFSKVDFQAMRGFGVNVVAIGLTSVARSWAEGALVVVGLGVRQMGFLNIASRLVSTAQDLSASALLPVSMVAFARVGDNIERLRSAYLRASAVSHAAVSPLMVFMGVTAPVLIPFMFGPDQLESASVTPALVLTSFCYLGHSIDQGLHLGLGRPKRWFVFVITSYAFAVGVTVFCVRFGLLALVWAWAGSAIVQTIARAMVVAPLVATSTWRVLQPIVGVTLPALFSGLAAFGVMTVMATLPAVLILITSGLALGLVYLVATRLLRPRTFSDTLQMLPKRVSRPISWMFRMSATVG